MKRNTIKLWIALITIALCAICGLTLIITATNGSMYLAGTILLFTAIILCPFLELLPPFKSIGECPECGERVYAPHCKCGWKEQE